MKTKLFYIFAVLLFAVSCEDKSNLPLTLVLHTPQQVDNSITLNWDELDIPGFQYYMVMRASDGQNYAIINDILNPSSDAFHKEITTFADYSYPLDADSLYYRVMAVGNQTAMSKNILVRNENKVSLLTGQLQDAYYLEEAGKISVITHSNDNYYENKLKVFDLQSGQFLPNESTINLSSSVSWYMWGKYNGKTEFYNYDGNGIYVYDAATAEPITTLSTNYYNFWYDPYTINNKGVIYIYEYCLYMINRATGSLTQYYPTNQLYWADFLYYNSKDNKLYAMDENNYGRIVTFNLNDDGSVASDNVFTINNYSGVPVFIENSSLFFVNKSGQFNFLDMNTGTYYPTDLTVSSSYQISKAIFYNNAIYFANVDNSISYGDGGNLIYKISTSDYKIAQTIQLRSTPIQMFIINGYLYYFGQYNSNFYFLDKIKL